jgi:hypothetical protein
VNSLQLIELSCMNKANLFTFPLISILIYNQHLLVFCVGVMYSGEYDACDVTLSVYPHRASLENMPVHGGNRTYQRS